MSEITISKISKTALTKRLADLRLWREGLDEQIKHIEKLIVQHCFATPGKNDKLQDELHRLRKLVSSERLTIAFVPFATQRFYTKLQKPRALAHTAFLKLSKGHSPSPLQGKEPRGKFNEFIASKGLRIFKISSSCKSASMGSNVNMPRWIGHVKRWRVSMEHRTK